MDALAEFHSNLINLHMAGKPGESLFSRGLGVCCLSRCVMRDQLSPAISVLSVLSLTATWQQRVRPREAGLKPKRVLHPEGREGEEAQV